MRRYRPFLVYNPKRGWAFYPNHYVTPLTSKSLGSVQSRKIMRQRVGWFTTAALAAMFEKAERKP